MNAFELFGLISIDGKGAREEIDSVSSKGKELAESLGSAFATAGRWVVRGVAASAAAVGTLITSSVKNYAEYEQVAGGAQLMFGDAYDYIAEKSANAYKEVQMSQVDYLKQVNGFATGLKTAMKGNEQEAAELSHRIITAQADVVAATGQTQENVQNAFNGIMKNNFSMLDNLAMGITPSKEGFQDLIKTVNKWNKENGKATKYNINNIADCQKALLDYIEMQGVSGYAAAEAAGTISGSLAMMKASWQNLLVGIASDSHNLDELVTGFADSAVNVFDNISKRVPSIVKGINQMIKGLAPKLPGIVQDLLPGLVEGAVGLITGLASALPGIMQIIVDQLPFIMSQLATAAESIFKGVATSISQTFGALFDYVSLDLLDTGVSFESLATKAKGAFGKIASYFDDVFSEDGINFRALGEAIANLFDDTVRAIGTMFYNLVDQAPELLSKVGDAISNAWSNGVWPFIQGLFSATFGIELPDWEGVKTAISTAWTTKVWPFIQSYYKVMFGINLPEWSTVRDEITVWWGKVSTAISNYFKAVFSIFTEDADGATAAERIRLWWEKCMIAIGDIFFAIFCIKTEDEDGSTVGKRIKEWWAKVVGSVGDIFWSTFKVFTEDADGKTVGQRIIDWWLKVQEARGDIFKETFKLVFPKLSDVLADVSSWWEDIKKNINLSIGFNLLPTGGAVSNALLNGANGNTSTSLPSTSSSSAFSSSGGLFNGLKKSITGYHAEGAVFSKPTLFDTRLGYRMVGEGSESEAVAPISVLQGYVAEAVAAQNAGVVNALERVVDAINEMNDSMGSNLRGALDGVSLGVNKREFGRLVKAVT